MRDEGAAGPTRGMFYVEHFVEEDVLDDELRNGGMIHAAIEKNLIWAGIVAAELAAPSAFAPAEMRASESSGEIFFVHRVKQCRKIEVAALRIRGGRANASAAHALNALASALRASVVEIRLH